MTVPSAACTVGTGGAVTHGTVMHVPPVAQAGGNRLILPCTCRSPSCMAVQVHHPTSPSPGGPLPAHFSPILKMSFLSSSMVTIRLCIVVALICISVIHGWLFTMAAAATLTQTTTSPCVTVCLLSDGLSSCLALPVFLLQPERSYSIPLHSESLTTPGIKGRFFDNPHRGARMLDNGCNVF